MFNFVPSTDIYLILIHIKQCSNKNNFTTYYIEVVYIGYLFRLLHLYNFMNFVSMYKIMFIFIKHSVEIKLQSLYVKIKMLHSFVSLS